MQDKSILVFGGFNGLSQALVRELTGSGADVGLLTTEKVARFLENINDAREVRSSNGRSAQIDVAITDANSAFEAVSRMAELFGRVDALVDLQMASLAGTATSVATSKLLLDQVDRLFQSKKRGRVVFLREDESLVPLLEPAILEAVRSEFEPWFQEVARSMKSPQFAANLLTVGLTEDLLLKRFPQSRSIRASMDEMAKEHPTIRLVDANEIANAVLFLASTGSSGLAGQKLRVARDL